MLCAEMESGIQIHKLLTLWPGHCRDWDRHSHSYKYEICNNRDVIGSSAFIHHLNRCKLACVYSVRL